jgi:hypothetical protein
MNFYEDRFKRVKWKVEVTDEVKDEIEALKSASRNPREIQDLLDKYVRILEKGYPPDSPPFGRGIPDFIDPNQMTYPVDRHQKLRIKVLYQLELETCFITKASGHQPS